MAAFGLCRVQASQPFIKCHLGRDCRSPETGDGDGVSPLGNLDFASRKRVKCIPGGMVAYFPALNRVPEGDE